MVTKMHIKKRKLPTNRKASVRMYVTALAFLMCFLTVTLLFLNTNIRKDSNIEYSDGYYVITDDTYPQNSAIYLQKHWSLIPGLKLEDIDKLDDWTNKDLLDKYDHKEEVMIYGAGWDVCGKYAYDVDRGLSADNSSFFYDGLNLKSAAYLVSIKLPDDKFSVKLNLSDVNGRAYVYCNGSFVGNLGNPQHSDMFRFDGGYNDITLQKSKDGTIDLLIIVYTNNLVSDPGLINIPAFLPNDINPIWHSFSAVILFLVEATALVCIIGGFMLRKTLTNSAEYWGLVAYILSFVLYYIFDMGFCSAVSIVKVGIKFFLLLLNATLSYIFISSLTIDGNAKKVTDFRKIDTQIVVCIAAFLWMLAFLDTRLILTEYISYASLFFIYLVGTGNLLKSIIFFKDRDNATVTLCSSVTIFCILYTMFSTGMLKVNIPLYGIFFVFGILALETVFIRKYVFQYAELSSTSKHLQYMVEEKTKHISSINKDLYDVNNRLLANEEARKNVMSNVSHDLRTPITAIRGYAELLLNSGDNIDKEKQRTYLTNIVKRSQQMERIVSDIVEISRMESSNEEFEFTDLSMRELLEEMYLLYDGELSGMGGDKKIFLSLPEDDLLIVRADPKRISRVFENLISNAVNYSKAEAAEIRLSGERDEDGYIVLKVSDNGIGIPENEVQNIFDRFYRAKNSGQNIKGTGLGLSIVKMIIDKHDGIITVNSKLGEGTEFTVKLHAVD